LGRGDEDSQDTRSTDVSDQGDELAKDVLPDQPHRPALGERLSRRVGQRRFERAPIVSCTGRLFERYDIADPWDPDSKDRPVALGPVGMRFEERRQPAPHAKVKEPRKKESEKPAWTPPKGIPDARGSQPQPSPRPAARSAPSSARRPASPATADAAPAEGQPAPLPPIAPPPRGTMAKSQRSGRFRMKPTSTAGPKVREVRRVVEAPAPGVEAPAEEEPARPVAPQPQSLDDLFGNLGGGGRDKRVRRKKD
jgi:hypothetical protein